MGKDVTNAKVAWVAGLRSMRKKAADPHPPAAAHANRHDGAAAHPHKPADGHPAKDEHKTHHADQTDERADAAAKDGTPPASKPEPEKGESKPEEGIAVALLHLITKTVGDVTLSAQVGSAMPDGAKAGDYIWKGPVSTIVEFPREKSFPFRETLAYAQVEIAFDYSGKYIDNFHAKLIEAELDRTADLAAELSVDDKRVSNGPGQVAHLDWTVTFRYTHIFGGSKLVTVTGRASGDGTFATSQPSIVDLIQENVQAAQAAKDAHQP